MCTKVAVSSVIDGGRKLVEVEEEGNFPPAPTTYAHVVVLV